MSLFGNLPTYILANIFKRACSACVLSIKEWKLGLKLLAVGGFWRTINRSILYEVLIIEYKTPHTVYTGGQSNASIIQQNGYRYMVKTAIIHAPQFTNRGSNADGIYNTVPVLLSMWFGITVLVPQPPFDGPAPPAMSTRITEPLFAALPSLNQVLIRTSDMRYIPVLTSCVMVTTCADNVSVNGGEPVPNAIVKLVKSYKTLDIGMIPQCSPEYSYAHEANSTRCRPFQLCVRYIDWLNRNLIMSRHITRSFILHRSFDVSNSALVYMHRANNYPFREVVYCPRIVLVDECNNARMFEMYRRIH